MARKWYDAMEGCLRAKHIYAPTSHPNTTTNLNDIKGYVDCMRARWNQRLRHMWESLDSGFASDEGLILLLRSRYQQTSQPPYSDSQKTLDIPHLPPEKHIPSIPQSRTIASTAPLRKFIMLYLRMFEVHFMLTQLSVALLGIHLYVLLTPPFLANALLHLCFHATQLLSAVSYLTMLTSSILYERHHEFCHSLREADILDVGARRWQALCARDVDDSRSTIYGLHLTVPGPTADPPENSGAHSSDGVPFPVSLAIRAALARLIAATIKINHTFRDLSKPLLHRRIFSSTSCTGVTLFHHPPASLTHLRPFLSEPRSSGGVSGPLSASTSSGSSPSGSSGYTSPT